MSRLPFTPRLVAVLATHLAAASMLVLFLGEQVLVYYHAERVRTQLRDSPAGRPTQNRPSPDDQVIGLARVGGLHHRYVWREAG